VRIDSSPVYLDSSALAKLFLPERHSEVVERALHGRSDVILSDLAVTEFVSVIARRVRERTLRASQARRLYRRLLQDLSRGEFLRIDLTEPCHRQAERLLFTLGERTPLRSADALHLALASAARAATLFTFDRRLAAAATILGGFDVVGPQRP
jgi:predicted nucleic acid-binding protein